MILFSILFTYILIEGLTALSDSEYDPSGNSDSSFHSWADFLNLLFLYDLYDYILPCIIHAKI